MIGNFIQVLLSRIRQDGIALEAGALAYTSILALVPAVTIVLSIFAMVPAFQPLKSELMTFTTQNFLPVFADAIVDSVTTFVDHAASTTLTGAIMLIVVSLMMIRAVDKSLNRIWRGGKRKPAMTFAIYWTLLTVGPLSFAVLLWATSQVIASKLFVEYELGFAIKTVYFILPFIVEIGMMFALYMVMPVADVKPLDALTGAFVTAIAFELLKRVFSIFIMNFSSYEAIYGALAAAPVLMIWIYLNWWLVLLGAEFTSVLGVVKSNKSNQLSNEISTHIYQTQMLQSALNQKEEPIAAPSELAKQATPMEDRAERHSKLKVKIFNRKSVKDHV